MPDGNSTHRLMTLAQALAAALRSLKPIPITERVRLGDAYGRVLAKALPFSGLSVE